MHPALGALLRHRRGPLFDVGPDAVGRRIRDHLRSLGIDATAHQLRHSFGTELARVTGGDLQAVAVWMGHASMDTTMGYARFADRGGGAAVARMYAADDDLPPAA